MSREIDRRDHSASRDTPARQNKLRSLASETSDRIPGAHRIRITRIDPGTGNPAAIASEAAPATTGDYIARALAHVGQISSVLGLESTRGAEYVPDPNVQHTSSGAVAVHLHQRFKSIPIFQAAETVRFAADGALTETVGRSITVTNDAPADALLSVEEAVSKAAVHVAIPHPDEQGGTDVFGEPYYPPSVDVTGFMPDIITTQATNPERTTILEAGPFGENIKASLIWFEFNDALRLTWEVLTTMPDFSGQYRTLVDAENGEILYCRQLMQTAVARGNVYHVDGSRPRQMTDFPRAVQDYGLPIRNGLPAGFPRHWVEEDASLGNSVDAHLGNSGPGIRGNIQNNIVIMDPADDTGDDQKVLNIFYYNCYMHDYFYLLGFDERHGNFQQSNFGLGGSPSDRVDARAHSGAVTGTANMGTRIDGVSPVMNMGLVTSTGRHTAFDSSVVFHEFMHGVTNRLVGGPMNVRALDAPQSRGMGEGWGDYIACTINDTNVVGDWVVNNAGGIRRFPYDSQFPDTFADLGTGRYTADREHNIGEIWCATLLEANRRIDPRLMTQLVVDALMLAPASPSFLDMRDAILSALDNKASAGQIDAGGHTTTKSRIWEVFAKFGMGENASSNGASLSGIVADFVPPRDAPPESVVVEGAPDIAIPDSPEPGVRHGLSVDQTGRVKSLHVAVDIQHTYIGDLVVSLVAPGGTSVVLHNRSGGSADNLVRSYSSGDTAALMPLVGADARGEWTLTVSDRASRDTGVLRHWRLELDVEPTSGNASGEDAPGTRIPDKDPAGIESTIPISASGTVQTLTVEVDITHTYIGDLRVTLVAPSGRTAVLHDRAGRWRDNLIETYDSLSTPALAVLAGEQTEGSWKLRVSDLAGQDVGKLNRWSIAIAL